MKYRSLKKNHITFPNIICKYSGKDTALGFITCYLGRKNKVFNNGSQLSENKGRPGESVIIGHSTNEKCKVVYFSVISVRGFKSECLYTTSTYFSLKNINSWQFFVLCCIHITSNIPIKIFPCLLIT